MTAGEARLTAGALALTLAPALGGAVIAFTRNGTDLFRPLTVPAGRRPDALHAGMFPMLPFANAIRDNRFGFDGRSYEVTPNMVGARLNYHGSGWQSAWAVADAGTDFAELVLADGRVDDVYRYGASQRFRLSPDSLEVETSLTNRGPRPMPFSFGQHPWLPRHGNALVRFVATGLWHEDEAGHTTRLEPVPPAPDYRDWRAPPRTYLNTCYAGWSGRAEIAWPGLGFGIAIEADPVFRHLMVHVPAHTGEVICLEPQTNAPCGFDGIESGHRGPGVHILAPGESVAGRLRFAVFTELSARGVPAL